ncbi:MAG: isoprenylcysteine carboxylmethyltransferase family protein [Bacteroidota bacterium]
MDPHIIFGLLWIGYFTLHSLLADPRTKAFAKQLLGKYFRWYRIFYNLLALGLLAPILLYRDSFSSPQFIDFPGKEILAGTLAFLGSLIMYLAFQSYDTGEFLGLKNPEGLYQELATRGLHAYTRHPLYFGTIIFLIGYLLYASSLSAVVTVGVIFLYLFIGTLLEERKLLVQYGDTYKAYKKQVKMLIPYVF